jgi:hypothetical protein
VLLFLGHNDNLNGPIERQKEPRESVDEKAVQATTHEGGHLQPVDSGRLITQPYNETQMHAGQPGAPLPARDHRVSGRSRVLA